MDYGMIKLELLVTATELKAMSAALSAVRSEAPAPEAEAPAPAPEPEAPAPAPEAPEAEAPAPAPEPEAPAPEAPTPEAPAPAPAAPEAELAPCTTGELIPWDVRIHASSKAKLTNGSWKLKQGVDRDELVPEVEKELIGKHQPPTPAEGEMTFADLLPMIIDLKENGGLTDEKLQEACTAVGLSTFGEIARNTDKIPALVEIIKREVS